jgi:integrase
MYLTGTRITDALSLRWEDVELAKGRQAILATVNAVDVFVTTGRTVHKII